MTTEYTPHQLQLIEKNRDINVSEECWSEATIEQFVTQLGAYGIEITTHDVKLMNGDTRQDPDVFWTGFWSQGDGACFDCSHLYVDSLLHAGQRVMSLPDDDDLAYLKESTEPVPDALRAMYRRLESEFATCLLSGAAMELLDLAALKVTLNHGHYSHSGNMSVGMEWEGDEKEDYSEADQQLITKLEEEGALMQGFLRGLADLLYAELETRHNYLTEDEQVWDAIVANDLDEPDTDDEEETGGPERLAA